MAGRPARRSKPPAVLERLDTTIVLEPEDVATVEDYIRQEA